MATSLSIAGGLVCDDGARVLFTAGFATSCALADSDDNGNRGHHIVSDWVSQSVLGTRILELSLTIHAGAATANDLAGGITSGLFRGCGYD